MQSVNRRYVTEQRGSVTRLLLSGSSPGENAGNSVSTQVLLDALELLGDTTVLSHRMSVIPRWITAPDGPGNRVLLGTQPLSVHSESLLAGYMHRDRLHGWQGGWVVNSRYAGALFAAKLPYVIWEATTIRDELRTSTIRTARRSGKGTGFGRALHSAMLPVDERLERRFYQRAMAVLAMSSYTRDRIIEQHGIKSERIGILTHPPSIAFTKALTLRGSACSAGPYDQDLPWRLLFVGRANDPRKNFGLLLAVMHRLRSTGHNVRLTVVGPHPDHWRAALPLEGVADAVDFTGAIPLEKLVDAYASHHLLVVPSLQEGFGIVVAEAFAAGLPVIATRCGGPEQIINESGAGILTDHDAGAMSHAVEQLMGDPQRRSLMRGRALQYARSRLSFEVFAESVASITEQLLLAPNPCRSVVR